MRFNTDPLHRCPTCRVISSRCICSAAPRITLPVAVEVMTHFSELPKSSGTARLLPLALARSRLWVRGIPAVLDPQPSFLPSHAVPAGEFRSHDDDHVLVLFPLEGSRPLTEDLARSLKGSVTLLVPDGNWNQAARMVRREPMFRDAEAVHLPAGPASRYTLRRQSDEGRLCTYEAVMRALACFVGEGPLRDAEAYLDLMMERVRTSKGVRGSDRDSRPQAARSRSSS